MQNTRSISRKELAQWIVLALMFILYHIVFFVQDRLPIHGIKLALFFIAYFPIYTVFLIGIFKYCGGGPKLKNMGFRLSLGELGLKYWLKVCGLFFLAFVGVLNILNWIHIKIEVTRAYGSPDLFQIYNYLFLPIPEEILYRCILCTIVARRFGWYIAIFVSTISFGLVHLTNDGSWQVPFILGFLCSWSFYKSKTILLPLTLHWLLNTFVLLLGVYPTLWERFVSLIVF